MAVQTHSLGSFSNDAGQTVSFYYKYDDQSFIVTAGGCVNQTPQAAAATLTQIDSNGNLTSRTRTVNFPANATTELNVPTGQANRFNLFVNPQNGKLDGVDIQLIWPA